MANSSFAFWHFMETFFPTFFPSNFYWLSWAVLLNGVVFLSPVPTVGNLDHPQRFVVMVAISLRPSKVQLGTQLWFFPPFGISRSKGMHFFKATYWSIIYLESSAHINMQMPKLTLICILEASWHVRKDSDVCCQISPRKVVYWSCWSFLTWDGDTNALLKSRVDGKFLGGPVVRTLCSYCWGPRFVVDELRSHRLNGTAKNKAIK